MSNNDVELIFVYSDLHIAKEKSIASKVGKTFQCGSVTTNSSSKDYTKMLTASNLQNFIDIYPDVIIVHKVMKSKAAYVEPKLVSIK